MIKVKYSIYKGARKINKVKLVSQSEYQELKLDNKVGLVQNLQVI